MPVGLLLLVAFITVPLIEVALFIRVGSWIGLWPTLLAIVATALIGSFVIRQQGFDLARRAQGKLAGGGMPVREGFDGLCLVVAGLLMVTPGFFTDAVGACLLVPALRGVLYRRLARRIEVHVGSGPGQGGGPRPGGDPTVVDADYEVVEDETQPLPPPRGDWGPRNR